VRAWTIRKGTKAPQAAGVIHTDFEKNFVCGEIMKFEDLKELGTEAAVKAAGKYITKGKDYEVQVLSLSFVKSDFRMEIFVIGSPGRNSQIERCIASEHSLIGSSPNPCFCCGVHIKSIRACCFDREVHPRRSF